MDLMKIVKNQQKKKMKLHYIHKQSDGLNFLSTEISSFRKIMKQISINHTQRVMLNLKKVMNEIEAKYYTLCKRFVCVVKWKIENIFKVFAL